MRYTQYHSVANLDAGLWDLIVELYAAFNRLFSFTRSWHRQSSLRREKFVGTTQLGDPE